MEHRAVFPEARCFHWSNITTLLTCVLYFGSIASNLVHAQVAPITASGLNTQISSPIAVGGQTQYDITGGTRPGGGANLFHSFGEFGVPTNNIANFLNETALPTSNILGRVTGGNLSNIFGTIQTTGFGNANLFLMNPTGFLFGPNAIVNVGGLVAFTSADYLKLADNARFNAIPNAAADVLLSASPVVSFGFLGSNPGAITVRGSQITVTEGSGISLVGGNITVQSARLAAPGGQINLASIASAGEVSAGDFMPASGMTRGSITLAQGATLDVSANAAGTVRIRGGELVMAESTISSDTINGNGAAGVDINVTGNLSIDGPGSSIFTRTFGEGAGGNIFVDANSVTLQNGGTLSATTSGTEATATGGTIAVHANQIQLNNQATITATSSDAGNAGTITMTAEENIAMLGNSSITSDSVGGEGNGGLVSLTAPSIEMHGNSNIETSTAGRGNSGNIELQGNQVNLTESFLSARTQAEGRGGNITIRGLTGEGSHATDVRLSDNSQLVSETIGDGENIQGAAGNILVETARLNLSGGSLFNTTSRGSTGAAGNITVNATDSLTISGFGTQINSDSMEFSFGDAGHISISAPSVVIENSGRISTSTSLVGNAGTIAVHTNNLQLLSGGHITSRSVIENPDFPEFAPTGNAGTVTIQGLASPADSVMISGMDENFNPSGIFTDTQGAGAGGNIFVNANTFTLQNGGMLSAKTSSTETTATGGNITVQGSDIQLKTGVIVTAETFGSGAGGKVTISADQRITVADSFILTGAIPELGEGGAGGDIVLNAPTLSLERSGLFASTSSTGKAGDVALQGQQITLVSDTVVATSTDGQGAAGTIKVVGIQGPGSRATSVALSNSRIESETVGNLGSEGHAGSIVMETARLTLTDSQLSTRSSFSQGSAGQLVVNASDQIQLVRSNITSSSEGGVTDAVTGDPLQTGDAGEIVMRAPHISIEDASRVTTSTEFNGQGGDINIVAGQSVTLNNGSSISASSSGAGNAGNILINAGQNYTSTDSTVTTQASQASGGNITVLATDTVHLTNSQLNASVQGSSTTVGGNITIDPQYVILQNSQILAQATQGQGGVIALTITNGGLFLPDATSTVSASSQFGVNGTVTIQSPNAPASGKIQPLGKTPLLATSLLNQRCAALAGGEFSSFTVAGRDSLPTEPGSWLASPLAPLNVGMGLGAKAEGVRPVAQGEELEGETAWLSLRQIAPAGFLTQAFALDWLTGCQS
jgi:filamentous hemagglutinin family protein